MTGPAGGGDNTIRMPSPYLGLVPYAATDAPLFFGRDTECEIVAANLMAARLTLLYGASGVGKSSILQAGVASRLQHHPSAGAAELLVLYNQWTGDPVSGLVQQVRESALRALGAVPEESAADASPTLADALTSWCDRLGTEMFIILDQFEDYFLYSEQAAEEGSFLTEFSRAVNRSDVRVNFLISIREDALAWLDHFKGRLPTLYDNSLRIQHLSTEGARAAITGPLTAYNERAGQAEQVTAEPELVREVLEQVQVGKVVVGETGRGEPKPEAHHPSRDTQVEAPYLQLVMTTLWAEERRQGSRVLRADTLRDLGGAQRIVWTHLDKALEALSRGEQDIAAATFHYLVTPSGSKISHSERDLADYGGLSPAQVRPVLEKLSSGDARVLRPVATTIGGPAERRYEIFHDVLAPGILHWRSRYLQQRATEAEFAQRLEREAADRQTAEEQAKVYRRKARNRGALALGMVLLLLGVAVAATVAVQQAKEARRGKIASQASELTAQAVAELPDDPAASVHLAAKAIRLRQSTPGAELVLRRAFGESRLRTVMRGHGGSVTSAVFSHDGKYVVTASNDGTARVWAADSGRSLAVLGVGGPANPLSPPQFTRDDQALLISTVGGKAYLWHWRSATSVIVSAGEVSAAVLDPTSGVIATGHRDGAIRIWNSFGHKIAELPARRNRPAFINSLAVSPDGHAVVSGTDGGAELWRWPARATPVPLSQGPVRDVAFCSDGRCVAAATENGPEVWSLPQPLGARSPPKLFFAPDSGAVDSLAFAPDSRRLVTVTGRTAQVWDTGSGVEVSELIGHTDDILQASFSQDGQEVVTASADASARVWNVQNGGQLLQLRGHAGAVFGAGFDPAGEQVVTGGADHTARLWSIATGHLLGVHNKAVNTAEFSPDGTRVATASDDTSARSLKVDQSGRGLYNLWGPGHELVNDVRFSRDGKHVVISHGNGVTVRDSAADSSHWTSSVPQWYQVTSAAFSSNGEFVAVGAGTTPAIWIWHKTPRPEKWHWANAPPAAVLNTDKILDVDFGPGKYSQLVLTAHADGIARLWDLNKRMLVRPLSDPGADVVYEARFSADGSRIVTANGDGRVRIWDTSTGRLVRRLEGVGRFALSAAALSPDGTLAAGGGADGTVLVWEVATGKLLALMHSHAGAVNSVEFSPTGGNLILTAGDDGTVKLGPCSTCRPLRDLLSMAEHHPM